MDEIRNFERIRGDGKVIDETMTVGQMLTLGWQPDKVVKVHWEHKGVPVVLQVSIGVLALVVPGRRFVAAIEEHDESGLNSTLSIFDADGCRRFVVPNTQKIEGETHKGLFCWFEPSRSEASNCFGVIYRPEGGSSMFQLDIDASCGDVLAAHRVR